MEVRGEREGDASWGRTSLKGHPAPGMWSSRWLEKISTPWVVFFSFGTVRQQPGSVPRTFKTLH